MDSDKKKLIPSGTYAGRELLSMLKGIVELKGKLRLKKSLAQMKEPEKCKK